MTPTQSWSESSVDFVLGETDPSNMVTEHQVVEDGFYGFYGVLLVIWYRYCLVVPRRGNVCGIVCCQLPVHFLEVFVLTYLLLTRIVAVVALLVLSAIPFPLRRWNFLSLL